MNRTAASACGAAAAAMIAIMAAPSLLRGDEHRQDQPAMPDMEAVMARWEAFMTPGDHHQHMTQWVGEWDLTVVMWQGPGGDPEQSQATSNARLIMGGRYLLEEVRGSFDMGGGEPTTFEGMALMGYDNHKNQYFSVWIDNMGTGLWEEWGTCDGEGKVLTTKGRSYDPMIGAERDSKSVATIVDADTRKLEMFMPGPDGRMFKNMEITYRRRK